MKKMKIENQEIIDIVNSLKLAGAAAIEFIALVLSIPADIMRGIARAMERTAHKLRRSLKGGYVYVSGDPDREDIIAEITDV